MPSLLPRRAVSPGHLTLLIAALQCVYILDFMLVLPLAPDLAAGIGFSSKHIGWLTAAYTAAAVLAGLAAVPWLDRWDRRTSLLCSLVGLAAATLASAMTASLTGLLVTRALAGLFGAPAIAAGMALLIDCTPPAQRGATMAKVMLGFTLAVTGGVPLALELAARLGWQAAFVLVAALAAAVALAAARLLPRRAPTPGTRTGYTSLLRRPAVRSACAIGALNQFAAFLIIPSMSAFYLYNLAFPRERLGLLYLGGGVCALLVAQLAGRACDRFGVRWPVALANLGFVAGLLPMFGATGASALPCFLLFMASNAARNVSLAAYLGGVPTPQERGGFIALQNLLQDGAITVAAVVAATVLGSDGAALTGTAPLAGLAALSAAWVWLSLRPATAAASAPAER